MNLKYKILDGAKLSRYLIKFSEKRVDETYSVLIVSTSLIGLIISDHLLLEKLAPTVANLLLLLVRILGLSALVNALVALYRLAHHSPFTASLSVHNLARLLLLA